MAIFSHKDSYIGLDIGTSSIKLVELQKDRDKSVRLVTYAYAKGVQSLAEGQSNDSVARLATIVREVSRRAGVTGANIIAALPSLSVFSTVLTLPQMNDTELEKAVVYAAKNYVPTPLKDVVLGWTVIRDNKEGAAARVSKGSIFSRAESLVKAPFKKEERGDEETSQEETQVRRNLARHDTEVFLTAAPKELVQRYSSVVERLNYSLIALEVESFPLSRSLLKNEKAPAMLVDIGDLATNFSIVENSYLRINQSANIGGASMTDAIVAKFGISREQAEEKKLQTGIGQGDEAASNAIRPVVRDIIERGVNLQRLFERRSRKSLGKIVLIGGGANLRGLPEFWKETTGLPTEVGNPWKGIRVPAVLNNKLLSMGPSFSVAVGLALREFEQSE